MNKLPPLIIACDVCGKTEETPEHQICSMFVVTEDDVLHLSPEKVVEILKKYFEGRFIHLSYSEVMLYRPDVVQEAFKKEFPEFVSATYGSAFLCSVCMDKYLDEYPLL
jgi:hypothetical protein